MRNTPSNKNSFSRNATRARISSLFRQTEPKPACACTAGPQLQTCRPISRSAHAAAGARPRLAPSGLGWAHASPLSSASASPREGTQAGARPQLRTAQEIGSAGGKSSVSHPEAAPHAQAPGGHCRVVQTEKGTWGMQTQGSAKVMARQPSGAGAKRNAYRCSAERKSKAGKTQEKQRCVVLFCTIAIAVLAAGKHACNRLSETSPSCGVNIAAAMLMGQRRLRLALAGH